MAKRVWKASEWQGASGKWYINDVSGLGADNSGDPKHPCNILDMTNDEFASFLKSEYGSTLIETEKDIVLFLFDTQNTARKYKNYINAQARKKQYMIGQ